MAPKPTAAAAAPSADPYEEKYYTTQLPAGMTVEDLVGDAPAEEPEGEAPETEGEPEAEAPARPARPAAPASGVPRRPAGAPASPAESVPPKRPLTDASRRKVVPLPELLKSREKITALSADNARIRSENQRLRGEALQRRILEANKVDPITLTPQDRQVMQQICAEESAKESDLGKVSAAIQIRTTEFLNAKYNSVRQTEAARHVAERDTDRLADSEDAIREKHLREGVAEGWDYDSVGKRSGIFQAFLIDPRTKDYYEPASVADIKAAANPAERAYQLGLARLQERGWVPEGETDDGTEGESAGEETTQPAARQPAQPRGPKQPAAALTPAGARRASAAEVDAAERRGERRGAAAVIDQAEQRGRGIRHLPSAGGGPARLQVTAAFLDSLKDRDPDKWLAILQNDKQLEYEYMSGTLS